LFYSGFPIAIVTGFNDERIFLGKIRVKIIGFDYTYRKSAIERLGDASVYSTGQVRTGKRGKFGDCGIILISLSVYRIANAERLAEGKENVRLIL
jgi:hypothetical protein